MRSMLSIMLLIGSFFLTSQPCFADEANQPVDIAILTMPKGGTNLLIKALHLITGEQFSLGSVQSINGKSVLFDHIWPGYEDLQTDPHVLKIIQIRDPRDMLISQMFWIEKMNQWGGGMLPKKYIKQFQSLRKDQKITFLINCPEKYCGPTYFCRALARWLNQPNVLIFRFEDLVGAEGGGNQKSQEESLGTLARSLGYDLNWETIEQIASQLYGNSPTFREGKIGAWKEYFGEDHKQLFKAQAALPLIQLGYETDANW